MLDYPMPRTDDDVPGRFLLSFQVINDRLFRVETETARMSKL